jgi:hypothetical protein
MPFNNTTHLVVHAEPVHVARPATAVPVGPVGVAAWLDGWWLQGARREAGVQKDKPLAAMQASNECRCCRAARHSYAAAKCSMRHRDALCTSRVCVAGPLRHGITGPARQHTLSACTAHHRSAARGQAPGTRRVAVRRAGGEQRVTTAHSVFPTCPPHCHPRVVPGASPRAGAAPASSQLASTAPPAKHTPASQPTRKRSQRGS